MGLHLFQETKNNYICCYISVRTAVCITETRYEKLWPASHNNFRILQKKGFKPNFLNSRFDNLNPIKDILYRGN